MNAKQETKIKVLFEKLEGKECEFIQIKNLLTESEL